MNLSTQSSHVKAAVLLQAMLNVGARRALGGPGSGNFGHAGRPGEVGGSGEGGVSVARQKNFSRVFEAAFADSPYTAMVSHYSQSEMAEGKMRPVTSNGGKTGLLVHDHGDGRVEATALYNVSDVKGAGIALLREAIDKHGVNYVEAYGPYLPAIYAALGFKTSDQYPFDLSKAASNWNTEKFDSPDYHVMHLEGAHGSRNDSQRNRKEARSGVGEEARRRGLEGGAGAYWRRISALGGPGSGNFGHAGRPGEVGGSSSEGSGASERTARSERTIARPSTDYNLMYAAGRDTLEQFSDGRGHYTKERAALHGAIIAKHMQGTTPVEKPIATILGGGPASGKTEVVNAEGLGKNNTVHVDVDEIRKSLPEYREGLGKDTAAAAFTHEESSYIAKQLMRTAIESKRNVLLDGTGDSSIEKLSAKVAGMRAAGHEVVAKYVTVDVETAVARAHARGEKTGRYVPETFIRETHAAVSRTFSEAIRQGLFDRATLYDTNTSASLESAGRSMRLVASAVGRELTIYDQTAWERFLAKGQQ